MDILKDVLSVIFMLVMFALILYLAYVTTKLIGKKYSVNGKKFKNLKVLETISIGADRQLVIVSTAGKCLLLGATSHNVSLICELDENKLENFEDQQNPMQTMSFSEALKRVCEDKFSKKDKNLTEENQNDTEG